jgi:hypothetical protein
MCYFDVKMRNCSKQQILRRKSLQKNYFVKKLKLLETYVLI